MRAAYYTLPDLSRLGSIRQGDEFGLAGYSVEAALAPTLACFLDRGPVAGDEVPPKESLAVERRAAQEHQPAR